MLFTFICAQDMNRSEYFLISTFLNINPYVHAKASFGHIMSDAAVNKTSIWLSDSTI